MPDLTAGEHTGIVTNTFWGTSAKGKLKLCVTVEIGGMPITGDIYFTPGTCRSPGDHDDGSPKRSFAERQLNAIGYVGDPRVARRHIVDGDLVGSSVGVRLKADDYWDDGRLKVDSFCERADDEMVDAELSKLFDPEQQPSDGWDDDEAKPKPEPEPEPTTPPAIPNDDVPF